MSLALATGLALKDQVPMCPADAGNRRGDVVVILEIFQSLVRQVPAFSAGAVLARVNERFREQSNRLSICLVCVYQLFSAQRRGTVKVYCAAFDRARCRGCEFNCPPENTQIGEDDSYLSGFIRSFRFPRTCKSVICMTD